MMNNDRIYDSHHAETRGIRAMIRLTRLCLTIAWGIGAVLALRFAPAAGKKIRDELAKTSEDDFAADWSGAIWRRLSRPR